MRREVNLACIADGPLDGLVGAWALIQSWVPDFDGWALADHASIAGFRIRAARAKTTAHHEGGCATSW